MLSAVPIGWGTEKYDGMFWVNAGSIIFETGSIGLFKPLFELKVNWVGTWDWPGKFIKFNWLRGATLEVIEE